MHSGYSLIDLKQEAQSRWLKPPEVLFILENHEEIQLTDRLPQKPASGSLFLYNKRVLRFFRKDGHSWRRKKDGKSVGEAHERLKVGNVEALNCYYAHGELNPNFQRRSYWMLDPAYEHIVLVHYRDITKLSPGSYSTLTQSPSSYGIQVPGSTADWEFQDPDQNHRFIIDPRSAEVSSDVDIKHNEVISLGVVERTGEDDNSSKLNISQALQSLEEQLSLNDDSLDEMGSFYYENENSNDVEHNVDGQSSLIFDGLRDDSNHLMTKLFPGDDKFHYCQSVEEGFSVEETAIWNEAVSLPPSITVSVEEQENSQQINVNGNEIQSCNAAQILLLNLTFTDFFEFRISYIFIAVSVSTLLPHEVDNFEFVSYSPAMNIYPTNSEHYSTMFEQGQTGMPLEATSSLTVAQKQKFTIHEISPEWGYADEATKVIIIGSFLCDPSDCTWTCMFSEIEVPVQIIQDGVICCHAPPNLSGKVTVCITSGNRESCSEVREFEYRDNPSNWTHSNLPQTEASRNLEELLLLVRLVKMLLLDSPVQKISSRSGIDLLDKVKADEESWNQVIEALPIDTWTSSSTKDWLLQELLSDKLQQWLSSRLQNGTGMHSCSLSKKEQGIIHMVAGLGFHWALNPILDFGVNVDFRDANGLTALHWAARFGREKMVAVLIARGASAGAVTDPTKQDPAGKTPASIAADCGHKGLAGYLSEVSLTSHLSSLTIAESELSKDIANLDAERTLNSISSTIEIASVDHLFLKDALAASRNAAQAAARIQSAFRVHSFRKRKLKEATALTAVVNNGDEYNFLSNDVQGLSAVSKLAFRNTRDYNGAALSIQKNYRGWKVQKDFLAFRHKVVKIQAHVRGHQVQKYYKVFCWAVSVLEKVVLRWHRRGVGLRGFRHESEAIDESEDEDIVKLLRIQKVNIGINEALLRVLSMVESPEAQQQYRRMLEKHCQVKAELEGTAGEEAAASTSQNVSSVEINGIY